MASHLYFLEDRKMKRKIIILTIFCIPHLLLGCGIGGFWMEGNPFHEKSQPYGTHWIKKGVTIEQRREDSWACGAAKTALAADHVIFSKEQLQHTKHPDGKDDFAPRTRLTKAWIACMESKGYHYEK
ncbi:hypothetical protein [Thauera linaloolentis]|uniref:hypothetical protein n=1 Tax=Thauera linaloolentis TaxID=76112 RepID=UPI0012B59890|nr:hypothetical protein [Thauera linaloolentis]MCM8566982.1 hypothetical protein [Thauera linaloolentis]